MIRLRILWYMIRYPRKFLYAMMEEPFTGECKITHEWLDKIKAKP